MQPYLWWTLYLEPPFCVRFGILHLITWLRWGSLFLFKIQSSEVLNNCFCLAVGTILVLVAACFYSKFNSKKVLQIWFFQLLAQSWFQWQLFSSQNSIQKSIEKFIFQLLARSWFWRQLFSAKKLQKNTKRIPPPNAAIPLVNPILRTSLLYQIWACPSDFDETGWNKRHDVLCFHEIFKNSTQKTKKYKNDSSSKCSHTLSEPYT